MKKVVFNLEEYDHKGRHKLKKIMANVYGLDSLSVDKKDKKLTPIEGINRMTVETKLLMLCYSERDSVGPAKQPEKKKKKKPKKEEPKKDDKKKDDVSELVKAYKAYDPHMTTIERTKMDITATLPAERISHIISLTTPRDACRLAVVCPFFKSLADSDSVWEKFLPSDYKDIISNSVSSSSLITSLSKKDLYFHLCRNPVVVKTSFLEAVLKLEKHTGHPWVYLIIWSVNDKKYTLTGDIDPVTMASKQRKQGFTGNFFAA